MEKRSSEMINGIVLDGDVVGLNQWSLKHLKRLLSGLCSALREEKVKTHFIEWSLNVKCAADEVKNFARRIKDKAGAEWAKEILYDYESITNFILLRIQHPHSYIFPTVWWRLYYIEREAEGAEGTGMEKLEKLAERRR